MEEINTKKEIEITAHGYQRVIERTECKRNNVQDFILKVWESGKQISDYDRKTQMYKYLTNVSVADGQRTIRVKGNAVYIFTKEGRYFITCYDIPQRVIQNKRK